jgi:hypothetical protein
MSIFINSSIKSGNMGEIVLTVKPKPLQEVTNGLREVK